MPEIKSLTKSVSNYVTVYPYKEIDRDEWPTYQNEKGDWVSYDEGWREIGFKCPYPTVSRLTQIRDLTSDMQVEKKSLKIVGGDPKGAAKFLVYNLIQDIMGLTDQGERVLYDKDSKEWLYNEFCKSSFLLNNFRSAYELIAGKVNAEEKKEEENFTDEPENISQGYSKSKTSESEKKPDDTPPMDSSDE